MDYFANLTPDLFLTTLETSLGVELAPFTHGLPSYINRVYEIRDFAGQAYVVKFYRPGRWSHEALLDEHQFLSDCADEDIPVVSPLLLSSGQTLGQYGDIPYAIFPRKAGRQFDVEDEEAWIRVGSLLGRIHNVGAQRRAPHRLNLTLAETTVQYKSELGSLASGVEKERYNDICNRIIEVVAPQFEGLKTQRIHGDFHVGNILNRLNEGIMVIDFDDMMNGPAVQDFWLLLPDYYPASRSYLNLLMLGYRDFREIDPQSALLIEGLRAMRMIYFAHWSALQREDYQFQQRYPDWGSATFWQKEVADLQGQYQNIVEALRSPL